MDTVALNLFLLSEMHHAMFILEQDRGFNTTVITSIRPITSFMERGGLMAHI